MRRPFDWGMAAGICGVLAVSFMVTECSFGVTNSEASTVMGKRYNPPYTTTDCTTDSQGKQSCSVTHHDEEYIVGFRCGGGVHETEVRRSFWYEVREGTPLLVEHRDGRWTHMHYIHWLTVQPGGGW